MRTFSALVLFFVSLWFLAAGVSMSTRWQPRIEPSARLAAGGVESPPGAAPAPAPGALRQLRPGALDRAIQVQRFGH